MEYIQVTVALWVDVGLAFRVGIEVESFADMRECRRDMLRPNNLRVLKVRCDQWEACAVISCYGNIVNPKKLETGLRTISAGIPYAFTD